MKYSDDLTDIEKDRTAQDAERIKYLEVKYNDTQTIRDKRNITAVADGER